MNTLEYWQECISQAADDCGLKMTDEQLKTISEWVQGGHENYGMAFYQPESHYPQEIKRLEGALKKEKSKIQCKECKGKGSITSHGPYHSATGSCWKCNGEGKVLP